MNSARDRKLAASGNLAQRWGWEAVSEGEVHLAPGCKTPGTITHRQPCSSGSRHTAQVRLVSGLSQPRHSRYPAAGCTPGPSNNAKGEEAKQSTGYSLQRWQLATQPRAQGAALLASTWVALQGSSGLETIFFFFFSHLWTKKMTAGLSALGESSFLLYF